MTSSTGYQLIVLKVTSKLKENLSWLKLESGGHRFQRIPPTETKGRIHTSSVTVAVLERKSENKDILNQKDLKIEWYSGTGKGGQHRNKKQCCCRIIHLPTGITESRQGRSRESNKLQCLEAIKTKLTSLNNEKKSNLENQDRANKIGSGQRGDKIRTYRIQDDMVIDHKTSKKQSWKKILKNGLLF